MRYNGEGGIVGGGRGPSQKRGNTSYRSKRKEEARRAADGKDASFASASAYSSEILSFLLLRPFLGMQTSPLFLPPPPPPTHRHPTEEATDLTSFPISMRDLFLLHSNVFEVFPG